VPHHAASSEVISIRSDGNQEEIEERIVYGWFIIITMSVKFVFWWPKGTMDELIRMIGNETSSLVIVSGLNVAIRLATAINDPGINGQLLKLAKSVITLYSLFY
jgi:hypothetical protein